MADYYFTSGGHDYRIEGDRLDPYYAAACKIASTWAHIEFTMDALIAEMVEGTPSMTQCVTTQLNGIAPRVRAITALMIQRGAVGGSNTLIGRLKVFQGKSYDLVDYRNRAVHDLWAMRDDGIAHQFCLAIVKNKLEFGLQPRSLKQMSADHERVAKFRSEFIALRDDIRSWLQSLPETWRQGLPVLTIQDPP